MPACCVKSKLAAVKRVGENDLAVFGCEECGASL